MSGSLVKNLDIAYGGAAVAAANNTDDNSTIFDMQGYKHVVALTTITDSTDTGTCTLSIQTNSANSDTGMTEATGATLTATSAANDDLNGLYLCVELKNVLERYVQATRVTATANGAFGEVYVIRHNGVGRGMKVPITQGATAAAAPVSVVDA
jgi:hypothetical protein